MDTKSKTVGQWLAMIDDGTLCLPRFQRQTVWKSAMVIKLLETIINHPNDMPVGVFLVLETDSEEPVFPPRNIDGSSGNKEECRNLLLDGQQRITALWQALNDKDEDYRYYVKFDDKYKVDKIERSSKRTKIEERREADPKKQFKKKWFPVHLLNPSRNETDISNWVRELKCNADDKDKILNLIKKVRRIFSKRKGKDEDKDERKIIPFFKLSSRKTDKDNAIEVYERINTNSVKLSHHYLAVAKMEKETEESLYDVATQLEGQVNKISDLETDEIGELILKIFCLMEGKIPSGGNYGNLDYHELLNSKKAIFDGVEWAVQKLTELEIWYGKQLPSVVPLRVLSALRAKNPSFRETRNIRKLINRYLWHAFLTDRYSKQANQRLKEDFEDIGKFLKGTKTQDNLRIFKDADKPSKEDIKSEGWPQDTAKSMLSRGIILICCTGGAETLKDGIQLDDKNYKDRERHHIFPKSQLARISDVHANLALNCMLIPAEENQKFGNDLPGDYINKLFEDVVGGLPQLDVARRLETHCIGEDIARKLVSVTEQMKNYEIRDIYDEFLEARAVEVYQKTIQLFKDGEL